MSNLCPVCFNFLSDDSFYALSSCDHYCCKACLKRHLEIGITENLVLSCPICPHPLHPSDVLFILGPGELYEKYEKFSVRQVLLQDPDVRWCPAPDCGYAVIASNCAACPKLKCERPGCGKYFCYNCYSEWHGGQPCKKDDERNFKIKFEDPHLPSVELKKCPRCTVPVVKEPHTCNLMNCPMCKVKFCWLCLQQVGYMHYLDQNSECRLYSEKLKPMSNGELLLWELGVLFLAPFVLLLVFGLIMSCLVFVMPIVVCRKLRKRYASRRMGCCRTCFIIVAGVIICTVTVLLSVPFLIVTLTPPLLIGIYAIAFFSLCFTCCSILCSSCCRKVVNHADANETLDDPELDPHLLKDGPIQVIINVKGSDRSIKASPKKTRRDSI